MTRVRRDLPNRSSIGGLFVNRQGTGRLSRADDYNRTYALDGRWGIGQNGMVSGFYGGTQTPGRIGRDHALSLSGIYNSEMWRISSGYKENGEDFNPEVGFVRRTGFRNYDLAVQNTSRPEGFLKFQELRPHMSYSHFWNFDGLTETTYLHTHFQGEFEDSSSAGIAYDVRSENVFDTFSVSGLAIPPGRYDWSEVSSSVYYDRSAPVSAGVRAEAGGFFGGSIVTLRRRCGPASARSSTCSSATAAMTSICRPAARSPTSPACGRATTSRRGCSCRRCCSTTTARNSGR